MQNKNPQGSLISAPENDLERYGVWIKSDPNNGLIDTAAQKQTQTAAKNQTDIVDMDSLDIPELSLDIDDDFDILSIEETRTPVLESDDTKPENINELLPEDELGLLELDADADSSVPAQQTASFPDSNDIIEITLDELDDIPAAQAKTTEQARPDKPEPKTEKHGDFELTEVSLEDFGLDSDDTPAASRPSQAQHDETILEFEDIGLESADGSLEETSTDEFEPLDIDLDFDNTIPITDEHTESIDIETQDDGLSEFETVDLNSFGDALEAQAKPEGTAFASRAEPIEAFDDVQALTDELQTQPAHEESSDLLQKIASDLLSIKEELVSLRGQLSTLKSQTPSAQEAAQKTEAAPSLEAEENAGGFFDDEEDDTIALTGDELDNILNTADFTEESAAIQDVQLPSSDASLEDLLPEDGIYTSPSEKNETHEAASGDDSTIDLDAGIEEIQADTVQHEADINLLELNTDEGVVPLTNEPDDTSHLDEPSELDDLVIEDVPLVEPAASDIDGFMDDTLEFPDDGVPFIEPTADETADDGSLEALEDEIILDIESDEKEALPHERPIEAVDEMPCTVPPAPPQSSPKPDSEGKLSSDIKSVLLYLDQLLASLPEEKIEEFASSEYYDTYKRLFDDLGLL